MTVSCTPPSAPPKPRQKLLLTWVFASPSVDAIERAMSSEDRRGQYGGRLLSWVSCWVTSRGPLPQNAVYSESSRLIGIER
jgi:hypothetical protein